MSRRHHADKELRPPKPVRQSARRALRQKVRTDLRMIDDPDGAVVAEPRFDRPPRVKRAKATRVRHWKLKSWKRRNVERRQRNAEADELERQIA